MIRVSVIRLIAAIGEADTFKLPNMNAGTEYLYNKLYMRLSQNMDVRLSELDFAKFEIDDIDTMRELSDALEADEYKAEAIVRSLCRLPPVVSAAAFV